MIRYESQCVNCGFPCRYEACRNYRVKVLICDDCKDEVQELFYGVSGMELCADCALKELEKVE